METGFHAAGIINLSRAREAKHDATGLSEPFTFCGPVRYQHHEGSKPMSIIWELEYELPARLLHLARRTVL